LSDSVIRSRQSFHLELVPLLRDMILTCELQAGEKISEPKLCKRFGVSRTPLREALKVLAAEGLVVLQPNRGASIASITPAEVDELFPIMGALEALAGERACERMTDGGMLKIRALHGSMVHHYRSGDSAMASKLGRMVHETIFELAANQELTRIYNSLIVRIHSTRFKAHFGSNLEQSVQDHELIVGALEARDGPRLGAILKDHLNHLAQMVHQSLQATLSIPPKTGRPRKRRLK
jgi:DNA-binding GntR family transcriptional regulator